MSSSLIITVLLFFLNNFRNTIKDLRDENKETVNMTRIKEERIDTERLKIATGVAVLNQTLKDMERRIEIIERSLHDGQTTRAGR